MTFVKRIKVSMFSLLTVFSLLTFSCKKGDAGPAGPSGPAGPTGAVGTANVYYSGWVTATNFKDSIVDNSNLHIATVAATQLADSILQKADYLFILRLDQEYFRSHIHLTQAVKEVRSLLFPN